MPGEDLSASTVDFAGAFARAVVHHRNRRRQAVDEQRIVAHVQAVMVHLVNIHLPDAIGRADQFALDVPGQIAAVEETERSEVQHQHDAVGVVGGVRGLWSCLSRTADSFPRRPAPEQISVSRRTQRSVSFGAPAAGLSEISSPG